MLVLFENNVEMFLNASLPVPEILVSNKVFFRNSGATRVNSVVIVFQDMGFCTFRMYRLHRFAAPQTRPRVVVFVSLYMIVLPNVLERFLKTLDSIITVALRHRTRYKK